MTLTSRGASCRGRIGIGSCSRDEQPPSRYTPATRRRDAPRASGARKSPVIKVPSRAPGSTSCRPSPTTQSMLMKRRVQRFMSGTRCPSCGGKRLKPAALKVKFAGYDIGVLSQHSLAELRTILQPRGGRQARPALRGARGGEAHRGEAHRGGRHRKDRSVGALWVSIIWPWSAAPRRYRPANCSACASPRKSARILFGVVYVLDEPSAGLHPADTEALLRALDQLKSAGNLVVRGRARSRGDAPRRLDRGRGARRRRAWRPGGLQRSLRGPGARERLDHGALSERPEARASRSAPAEGLAGAQGRHAQQPQKHRRGVSARRVHGRHRRFRLRQIESGESGAGGPHRRSSRPRAGEAGGIRRAEFAAAGPVAGSIQSGASGIKRLVTIDQKPIGRTPRSNLATYTGLFDDVRKLFAATSSATARRYDAGRFSFNVAKGRCPGCEGEGFVSVELLFMPSAYAPCPDCHGARYNPKTLEVLYRGRKHRAGSADDGG